jgi:hypothetical protein
MMLVSLADTKSYLGISTADHDAFLTAQIGLVSEAIENFCRRKFEVATYVQTFYRSDYRISTTVDLFMFPVQSIVSVIEDDVAITDYRIHKPTGLITRAEGMFWGEETVITYTAGFNPVPATIQAVAFAILGERFNKQQSGISLNFGSDVQRVSIPGTIAIDFDYTLSNNERKTPFGLILGNHLNVLDYYRSERAIIGSGKLTYVS